MSRLWLGLDGGGSTVRAVVVDDRLNIVAEARGDGVNPRSIGADVAADRIGAVVRSVLAGAGTLPVGAGVGIAGADARHSSDWLRSVLGPVLPGVPLALSSDYEIAMVGALGQREGLLLLAGTGSMAYGRNQAGDTHRVGGWGYLLGDEGSGYWIGMQILKRLTDHYDGIKTKSLLLRDVEQRLGIHSRDDLIGWFYSGESRIRDVAALTELALARADERWCMDLLEDAARRLFFLLRVAAEQLNAIHDLNDFTLPVALTGGLLSADNVLSQRIVDFLGADARPPSRYPPAVGGALLAKLTYEDNL